MDTNATERMKWFCVRTQPKHEHIAAAHLRQIPNVEVFCPRLRFKKATTVGPKWFLQSMFPGYVFAQFDLIEQHRQVRYSAGVTTILQFGPYYATIDRTIIEEIRERTDAQQIAVIPTGFTPGDSVQIVQGALRGLEAVITQVLPGKERVRILVEFLGREIQAEVATPAVLTDTRHPLTV